MHPADLRMMLIGGPTVLLEWAGLRLLTDPTFDAAGGDYPLGPVVLHKTRGPALEAAALGTIDVVLLSHDHHQDNLDTAGRALLPGAGWVLTTRIGAERLGGNARGLDPWQTIEVPTPAGTPLRITATPARHGPEGCEPISGSVIGFVLQHEQETLYISGDTVWYDGVAEVAQRFQVTTAILFLGAARVPELGPEHLTMNGSDAVQTARALSQAVIVPAHHEGWAHFSEGREVLARCFDEAGLGERVHWLTHGQWETPVRR